MAREPYKLRPDALVHLNRYLDQIVEPTIQDFQRNILSPRHAFLACVATFHAIDRLVKPSANLRGAWRKQSAAFAMVDLVCHTLKHVETNTKDKPNTIPLRRAVLNEMGLNTHALNESSMDTHNLFFAVREAVKFIRQEADKMVRESASANHQYG